MIVRAQDRDAAMMAEAMGGWIRDTAWMPKLHTPEQDRAFCARLIAQQTVWIAHQSGGGFIAIDEGDVTALYLAPDLRGQGVGTQLLNTAKAAYDILTLWVFVANVGAHRFYLREGFAEVTRTDGANNDEKLPDIHMRWARGART